MHDGNCVTIQFWGLRTRKLAQHGSKTRSVIQTCQICGTVLHVRAFGFLGSSPDVSQRRAAGNGTYHAQSFPWNLFGKIPKRFINEAGCWHFIFFGGNVVEATGRTHHFLRFFPRVHATCLGTKIYMSILHSQSDGVSLCLAWWVSLLYSATIWQPTSSSLSTTTTATTTTATATATATTTTTSRRRRTTTIITTTTTNTNIYIYVDNHFAMRSSVKTDEHTTLLSIIPAGKEVATAAIPALAVSKKQQAVGQEVEGPAQCHSSEDLGCHIVAQCSRATPGSQSDRSSTWTMCQHGSPWSDATGADAKTKRCPDSPQNRPCLPVQQHQWRP